MEQKFIAIVDCLDHPNKAIREALKEKGLYVYDMRYWDEGLGNTLEPWVVVNYGGSVVTNFEITNWDFDDGHDKFINDMYAWIEKNDIEQKETGDPDLEKIVQEIIDSIQ